MTICIALLCEDNQKVVAIADRMTTATGLELEFEHAKLKIDEISKSVIALTAGDALAHTDLLRDVAAEIARLASPGVRRIAQEVEQKFIEARQNLAEKLVLQRAGLTYQAFLQQQRCMTAELVLGLTGAYQEVVLGVEILVAGVDDSGAHIYYIDDPGKATCFDSLGFAAIGSGLPHAVSFLTEVDYSASVTLNEALWITYEAKRRSERAPGVGNRFTDLVVIDKDGIHHLREAHVKQLEDIHEKYRTALRGTQAEIDKLVAQLHTKDEAKNENASDS